MAEDYLVDADVYDWSDDWRQAMSKDGMGGDATLPTTPSKPIANILYEYFVAESPVMGGLGFHPTKELTESMKSDIHATKATQSLKQLFLDTVGEDESQGDVHFDDGLTDLNYKIRNNLRAELRAKLEKL